MENDNPSLQYQSFNSNTITEELKKIAEIELHERECEIQEKLNRFKELLINEGDLNPCLDDKFLIMFLRARKFNCEASMKLVRKYYAARLKYPSMFKNFTPKSCMKVLKANIHYFLPYRSPDGCAVLLSKFGQWDPKLMTCEDLLKFNLLCNEMALQNPVTQICGVITIADMKDFSWSHLLQIPVNDIRCFVSTLQECLPIRNKAIHIINHSSIFSFLFAIVKPLLHDKMAQRIYFHGDDMNSLYQHLPAEILPKYLGGKLSNLSNEDFYNSLLNSDETFISQQNYGCYSNASQSG